MTRSVRPDHRSLAQALRRRVLEGSGKTSADLRQAVAARAAGGDPIDDPYDDLAQQIGKAAYRVTDRHVAEVVRVTGSDAAAFELIAAAAVGAGLLRWRTALEILEGSTDATA